MKSQVTLKTIAKALNLYFHCIQSFGRPVGCKFANKRNRDGIGHQIKLQAQYHGSET